MRHEGKCWDVQSMMRGIALFVLIFLINGCTHLKPVNLAPEITSTPSDAEIWKATFAENGDVASWKLHSACGEQGLESVDGLQIDAFGKLWTADFLGNAVAAICPKSGKVKIVAKNAPGTGEDGGLDAVSECIRRGDTVYGANIDLTYGPNESDGFHSISVIELP